MNIKVYGSRASIPFFSHKNINFGGNTTCIRVETAGHTILLDAGSGLFQYMMDMGSTPVEADILLGHLHLDHTIGLPMFKPLWQPSSKLRILTKDRVGDGSLAAQVFGSFRPPYWPITLEKLSRAELVALPLEEKFILADGVTVTAIDSPHMDQTIAFRIEGDKTLVYLVDFEMPGSDVERYVNFCRGADLVIFDACYLPSDTDGRQGWGHSTYESGLLLAERAGCDRMLFTHLNPEYGDAVLACESQLLAGTAHRFAFDGMEMIL